MRPSTGYVIAALGTTLLLAVLFARAMALNILLGWILAANVAAFMVFGYDKAIAGTATARIPERVLLLLALLGGTLGAWAGMQIFRHKTVKAAFRGRFWLIVLLQFVLLLAYLVLSR